jgi:hypothetical protein
VTPDVSIFQDVEDYFFNAKTIRLSQGFVSIARAGDFNFGQVFNLIHESKIWHLMVFWTKLVSCKLKRLISSIILKEVQILGENMNFLFLIYMLLTCQFYQKN